MDTERLATIGSQLGLSGVELRTWIENEQAKQRAERAAEREASKEADERTRQILELKLKLQEGAQSESARINTDSMSLPSAASSVLNPQKLLPLFDERRDDLHAYLQRFERVATGQDWPQEKWALAVSMCLSGEALTVIGRMTAADSLDYEKVKKALLQRFRFTAQGYQEKFRKARAEDGETGRQLAARLSGYFDHWIDMANVSRTFDSLRDHMVAEQFIRCCHPKLTIFLKERECKSLQELADAADRFIEAQNLSNLGKVPEDAKDVTRNPTDAPRKPPPRCMLCKRLGHQAHECRNPAKEVTKCKFCGKVGHKSDDCWSTKAHKEKSSACVVNENRDDFSLCHPTGKHKKEKSRDTFDKKPDRKSVV